MISNKTYDVNDKTYRSGNESVRRRSCGRKPTKTSDDPSDGRPIGRITRKNFADMFNIAAEQLPDICNKVVREADFRYRKLSQEQKETVYRRVLDSLLSGTLTASGPQRRDDWERGWLENLDSFVEEDFDVKCLLPKFVKQNEVVRYRNDYVMPLSNDFETSFVKVLRYHLFIKYFSGVDRIFEFGCGTGLNLVAAAELFKKKELWGLDWAENSCRIIDKLAAQFGINVRSKRFDLFTPDYQVPVDSSCGVFTIGAMEQLGTSFRPFVDFLLNKRPRVCINVETIYELYGQEILFDYLAAKYLEQRNYLRGYLDYLRQLERTGRVELIEVTKTFGSLYHDGYSYIVWRPRS